MTEHNQFAMLIALALMEPKHGEAQELCAIDILNITFKTVTRATVSERHRILGKVLSNQPSFYKIEQVIVSHGQICR
jgi:hypothetical protein